jgi:hypothetical protein
MISPPVPYSAPSPGFAPPSPAAPAKGLSDPQYSALLSYGLAAVLALGSVYLFTNRPWTLPPSSAGWALAIIWLGFAPTFVYLLGKSLDALPFLPILGANFALIYGLTVFSKDRTPGVVNSRIVSPESLVMALTGLALLYGGFMLTKHLLPNIVAPLNLPTAFDQSWLRGMVWFLMAVHFTFLVIPALQQLPSVASLQRPAGYAAFGLLYILWRQRWLPVGQKLVFLFICIPAELLWRFSTGALAQVVMFGLFFQIVIWYERRRIPWLLIIGTAAFFIHLQPVKSEYRKYTFQYGRYAHLNLIGKAQLFAQLIGKYYSGGITTSSIAEGGAASRLAHIRLLSYVMSHTPEPVPYWNGKTYELLYASLIPRVLWPSKPMETLGQDFGHRYGLLAEDDRVTSINLPWMVETYANFGTLGILFGMPILGFAFALLTEKFGRGGMDYLNFIVGTAILFQASVDQENNLSLVFGSLLFTTVALSLYFHLGHWLSTPARAHKRPASLAL